jgi:hypothetical protein
MPHDCPQVISFPTERDAMAEGIYRDEVLIDPKEIKTFRVTVGLPDEGYSHREFLIAARTLGEARLNALDRYRNLVVVVAAQERS